MDATHAATYLHPPAVVGAEEKTSDEEDSAGSSGGASRIFLKNEDGAGATIRLYLHSARTSKNRPAMAYDEVPKDLIDFLVATYYNNGDCTLNKPEYVDLEFVSDYTRDENRFRGPWNFRSNGSWNDWAYVNWGEERQGLVPAEIPMFAKYRRPTLPEDDPTVCQPWVYEAIIVSGLGRPRQNTVLTMKFKLEMKRRGGRQSGPCSSWVTTYRKVNCMAISEHCLVFPNDGADADCMLEVSPIQRQIPPPAVKSLCAPFLSSVQFPRFLPTRRSLSFRVLVSC
jgi:hypothetical protein